MADDSIIFLVHLYSIIWAFLKMKERYLFRVTKKFILSPIFFFLLFYVFKFLYVYIFIF